MFVCMKEILNQNFSMLHIQLITGRLECLMFVKEHLTHCVRMSSLVFMTELAGELVLGAPQPFLFSWLADVLPQPLGSAPADSGSRFLP